MISRRVVVIAPGRSGSTLLQTAFLARCDALTFFEPCRHSSTGALRHKLCADFVARFLECDLPKDGSSWKPQPLRSWLQHPYLEANTSCTLPPFSSVAATRAACRKARLLLVKEIRLVGQLSTLAAALRRLRGGAKGTVVLQLVRDPRPMLSSQKRLGWWSFGDGPKEGQHREIERVAKHTCDGMVADAKAGAALARSGEFLFISLRFEELTRHIPATTRQLYARLGLDLPQSTAEWLTRTVRGQCAHIDNSSETEKYEYSTCRKMNSRRSIWGAGLSLRERRAVTQRCAAAMQHFGYTSKPVRGRVFQSASRAKPPLTKLDSGR